MLILFDIDGTMLLTRGASTAAMESAGRELFGDQFSFGDIETAGRLDSLIWLDLARANGVDPSATNHDRFRALYSTELRRRLAVKGVAEALPGVAHLIEALTATGRVALGLLTGNYPETGTMKITAAGFDPSRFGVAAWGTDGPSRRHLPPVAMQRHAERCGAPIAAESVVIIGDTPHDIDCARHNGCRSLGVATGAFDTDALASAGADHAVDTLGDTDAIVRWIESIR